MDPPDSVSAAPFVLFDLQDVASPSARAFAMAGDDVARVVPMPALVPVPLAPPAVRGMLNDGGRIVTVVDPAALLGLTLQAPSAAYLMLLHQPGRAHGNLAIQVAQCAGFLAASALPRLVAAVGAGIAWLGAGPNGPVEVLDLDSILAQLMHLVESATVGPVAGLGGPLAGQGVRS